MELPALLRLLLFLLVLLAQQPMATVDGELNTNSSSYTVPEGVCFRILRSIEGGTAVSPVSAHRIGHSCPCSYWVSAVLTLHAFSSCLSLGSTASSLVHSVCSSLCSVLLARRSSRVCLSTGGCTDFRTAQARMCAPRTTATLGAKSVFPHTTRLSARTALRHWRKTVESADP